MPTPKWLVIAKNQYLLSTSSIRSIRKYFPYLLVSGLALYVLYLAPNFVGLFIDDAIEVLLSQVAVALVQILLFTIFIYFLVFPISYALREVQAGQLELILSAPVKPSDVILGEFIGLLPIYTAVVTIISGMFTAILTPIGLDLLQITIILVIFAVTFLSAAWIGIVIAAILRTNLGRSARGRDIGKGLSMIIALPLIAVMYAMLGGGMYEALANPETSGLVTTILGIFPSSWGAEIIIEFAVNPGNISTIGSETLIRFIGVIVFFIGSFWVGAKVANRAISLEPSTFGDSTVKKDGSFYHIVQSLSGGGLLGILVVSVFKDYVRRFENLSRVFYIIGFIFIMNVFLYRPEAPLDILEISSFIYAMLASFVALEVTMRGKESLYLFKKAPSGIGQLIKARLFHGWMIVIPVSTIVTAIQLIILVDSSISSILIVTSVVAINAAASMAIAIGVSLLNPVFSTNQSNHMMNMMAVIMISVIIMITALIVFDNLWIIMPTTWLFALPLLYLGKRNLGRIE